MQLDPFVSHASEVATVHAVHGVHLKLRLDVVKEQHLMVLRRCVRLGSRKTQRLGTVKVQLIHTWTSQSRSTFPMGSIVEMTRLSFWSR